MSTTARRKIISWLFVAFCAGSVLLALVPLALVLFVITLIVNALSRMLIWSMNRRTITKARKTEPAALGNAA